MDIHINFNKNKPFLICIDSDGCVMDTMNSKHHNCFGPKVIEEWNLQEHEKEILALWNEQNLTSKTRGINRFQGLSLLFSTISQWGIEIEGREALEKWCKKTMSLSNASLQKEISEHDNVCLRKALSWSNQVNQAIQEQPAVDCVFAYAKETMELLCQKADIAIISSANSEALKEEWNRLDCMKYVNVLCGQEAGTKAHCIHELMQSYDQGNVLMIGDALSDLKAAQENNVYFYPILATKESLSWKRLKEEVAPSFLKGECSEESMRKFEYEMEDNLK